MATDSQSNMSLEVIIDTCSQNQLDIHTADLPSSPRRVLFFDSSHSKYTEEKPYYSNIPFLKTGASNSNVQTREAELCLADLRGLESHLSLDRNGFELVQWHHEFEDLGEAVTNKAYPAVGKLLREHLGAEVRVVVFDHTVSRTSFPLFTPR